MRLKRKTAIVTGAAQGIGQGSIVTDMLEQAMTDESARGKILCRTPAVHCGAAEDEARVAAFPGSDDASSITGQVIYCDDGRMALNYTVPVRDGA